MEDDYTGGDICIDGSTDCIGNDIVYGSRTDIPGGDICIDGSTDCIGNDIVYGSRTDIHLKNQASTEWSGLELR